MSAKNSQKTMNCESTPRCLVVFMPTKRWHKMKNSGNMDAQTQDGSGEIKKTPTT